MKAVTHVRSRKTHFVAEDNLTFCGKLPNENYMEGNIEDENVCSVCYSRWRAGVILSSRETGPLKIGTVLYCGPDISSTGWVRIVSDQSNSKGNLLQPGVTDYDFIVTEHDHDHPNAVMPNFKATKEEAEKWL